MKLSLQLKLSQQLTMTPQLQQAIRLLQMPVLELNTQIAQALAENVMLESEDPEPQASDIEESPVVAGEAEESNLWSDMAGRRQKRVSLHRGRTRDVHAHGFGKASDARVLRHLRRATIDA